MNLIESSIIFEGNSKSKTNNISFCGLTLLNDNILFATARIASGKDTDDGNLGIWQSNDSGATWAGPYVPFETSFKGRKGCLRCGYITELNDGRLLMTCLWVDRGV